MELTERCQEIELILTDVDGVLTDGGIIFDNQGIETKRFHIHDGLGIKVWQRGGYHFGVITGRSSHIVKIRAAELGIELIRQGTETKLSTARDIARQLRLEPRQICFIGDDLPDLPVIRWAGLGVAVANAVAEVKEKAAYTTRLPGGDGAVRETVELILKAKERWDELIQSYTT